MHFQPHVTVATIVEREGLFLLVEEWDQGRRVVNQPAGHVEAGESLQAAAVRETREETGWDVELLGVVGLSLFHRGDSQATYFRTTFFARPLRQATTRLDDNIERAIWLCYDDMRAISDKMRSPLVIASVDRYLQGQRFPLAMIY